MHSQNLTCVWGYRRSLRLARHPKPCEKRLALWLMTLEPACNVRRERRVQAGLPAGAARTREREHLRIQT